MSTPSSHNDGQTAGREEFFRHGLNPNLNSPTQLQAQAAQQHHLPLQQQTFVNNSNTNSNIALQQQAAVLQQQAAAAAALNLQQGAQNPAAALPGPTQFVHWSNPLMGGPAFLQAQPQTTTAAAAPQQQQFNDFLFNIQAQAAYAAAAASVPAAQVNTAASQQETYSVLRVGNGNFLKIYHCPENAMGPMPGEAAFNPINPYNQQQTAAFHAVNAQTGAAGPGTLQQPTQQQQSQNQLGTTANSASPQVFNSYELFSSNTFTQLPTAEMPPLLLLGPTAKPPTMATNEQVTIEDANTTANMDATNLVIHNINNSNNNSNWSGANHNINAPLYAQFETNSNTADHLETSLTHTQSLTNNNSNSNINTTNEMITTEKTINAHIAIQPQQNPSINQEHVKSNITSSTATNINQQLPPTNSLKTEIPRQEAPKKRIVAEVKPMRMTYSDVLSKFNNQQQNLNQSNPITQNVTSSGSSTAGVANQRNTQKSLKNDSNANNSTNINVRRLGDDTPIINVRSSSKKSPTHENKENQQQQQINNKLNNQKRSNVNTLNSSNYNNNNVGGSSSSSSSSTSNKSATTIQKNLINNSKNNTFINNNNNGNGNNNGNSNNDNQQTKKQRSNKTSDIQNNGGKILFYFSMFMS